MKVDRSKATLAASVGGVLIGGTAVGVLMLSGTGNASPSPSEPVTPAAATTSEAAPTTVAPVKAVPTTKAPAVTSTSPVVAHSSVTVEAPKAKVQPQVQQKETTVTETTPAETSEPPAVDPTTQEPGTIPAPWYTPGGSLPDPNKLNRDGQPGRIRQPMP